MIIKMEPTITFLMLVFAQQAPSLTWAPAVSLEPLTVLKLPMQKWEISKCQSTADTAIKGSQLEPLRARGVWWWWWRWKRGVVFPMHRHSLRINSSYYVRPPHCAEFLPAAIHAKSSRPPSPCLLKVTATGISCGCIN